MTDESALIGKVLRHYTILERIGGGGMGVVYRAQDGHLDRFVAIKILPHESLADEAARKRFRREALALSKLNHPNIATVFDFDSQDGMDFLVMEYVAGERLQAEFGRGSLSENEVARLGVELAEGLAEAHKRGVIHRDLKPANLRLTPEGRLKILDFGLAKLVYPASTLPEAHTRSAVSTETNVVLGTFPYMAPEQWRGAGVDERTDIWAAGTVLYEFATGQRAFDKTSGTHLAAAILTEPPTPPCLINKHLSPAFERIVLKCLEKDPENRYPSARELAVDLRRLDPSSPSSARPRRGPPRRMWVAAAISAGLAVTVTLSLGGLRRKLFGGGKPASVHSLAVLPLENLSQDPAQEFFSDGMTDELVATLGKISTLRVISRSSTMIFKGVKKPIIEIAKALQVDALVEGSVFRSGDRVRINASLVTPKPERQLWADSYEREARDVFALQSDVAQAIARQIRARLTPEEAGRMASARPVDPAAHDAYLRGRALLLDRVDQSEYRTAAQQFEAAIQIDSSYAAPWAGLADMYYLISNLYLPPDEAMPKAELMAKRALQMDSTSAEAYATLGFVRSQYYMDWEGAEAALLRSIQLNGSYATARLYRGIVLKEIGRHPEALAELHYARRLDPESNYIAITEGHAYYCAGMYDSAAAVLQSVIARDPGNNTAHRVLAQCRGITGARDSAVQGIRTALSLGRDFVTLGTAANILAGAGKIPEARATLESLSQLSKREHVSAYWFAVAYAGLGDRDRAFDQLNLAYRNHDEDLAEIKVDPLMRSLRSDPRFGELLRRLRLAP